MKMSIPTELIPICLDDGLPMTTNLRTDENFVEDAGCFIPNHNCIDNVEHSMAGVEMRYACFRQIEEQGHEEATGQCKITPGYNLPAKYVFHTVGPIVQGELAGFQSYSCKNSLSILWPHFVIDKLAKS